jgi:hypothetical protein
MATRKQKVDQSLPKELQTIFISEKFSEEWHQEVSSVVPLGLNSSEIISSSGELITAFAIKLFEELVEMIQITF